MLIVGMGVVGGSLALAAFLWAVRNGQFSAEDLHEGGSAIFDSSDPPDTPTNQASARHGKRVR